MKNAIFLQLFNFLLMPFTDVKNVCLGFFFLSNHYHLKPYEFESSYKVTKVN